MVDEWRKALPKMRIEIQILGRNAAASFTSPTFVD